MKRLLFAFLFLLAPLLAHKPPNIGKPISSPVAVAEGALTLHERGFVLHYLDDSRLTVAFDGGPGSYSASWPHTANGVTITILVTYEFPVANPSEPQRELYRARFKAMVAEMVLTFQPDPVPTH